MFAKINITGTITSKTGMHIGGASGFSAIGAIDSSVIRDIRTDLPMIPGSSLKGKIRSLLAKAYNTEIAKTPDDDCEALTSLFGCAKKGNVHTSRILFSDMVMSNWEELKKYGITSKTEVKFENTIKRTTAVATPRQIERVIRGSEFPMSLVYEVQDEETMIKDFKILREGFRLLEYDYLGGHGSRGYGKVKFNGLAVKLAVGQVSDVVMEQCGQILSE